MAIGKSDRRPGSISSGSWCAVVDEVPADLDIVRYWDFAATEKTEFNDPDWTVGIKLGRDRNGGYWPLDMVRGRANPGDVERLLLNTAAQDGKRVRVGFGKDPGQAGKNQALHLVRALSGFTVAPAPEVATSSRGSDRSARSAAPAT
jgi:phage terminase large subunit-like protein